MKPEAGLRYSATIEIKPTFDVTSYDDLEVERKVAPVSEEAIDAQIERFRQSLAELSLDLSGYKVQFTPRSPNGSRFVDVVAIDRTGRIIG